MDRIAVLGMGLLGRGFALNLLDKGHEVRVWNRTESRAASLGDAGARVATSPAEAVKGAERVHLVLKADDAVDAVIEALRPSLAEGTPVVDHSTNLPRRVAERHARLRAEGLRYVHAPVFMGPQNSREATGLMLLSGPEEDEAILRPALETMTGRVIYLGSEPDKAAKLKITGNGMLVMLTAAMGDLFAMGAASGVDHEEILALFEQFAPSAAGMGRRAVGASRRDPPGFTMTMARKDVGLMLETAGEASQLTLLPAVAAAMDRAIAEGRGEEDFTALADPTR
ncbi:MAG: NAD(P)-dependent oxidoreductase [Myxococcales bacterium]|nr:NAD(P)-dependent oxidoreductase [Myxococcales bacterium]